MINFRSRQLRGREKITYKSYLKHMSHIREICVERILRSCVQVVPVLESCVGWMMMMVVVVVAITRSACRSVSGRFDESIVRSPTVVRAAVSFCVRFLIQSLRVQVLIVIFVDLQSIRVAPYEACQNESINTFEHYKY